MHEVSIAMAIVEQIDERTDASPGESIRAVHVRIGAMSGVAPEALEFAWELARIGTVVEEAALVIERVPLAIACEPCGNVQQIDRPFPIPVCPVCSTPSANIVSGRELEIARLEVWDANPAR